MRIDELEVGKSYLLAYRGEDNANRQCVEAKVVNLTDSYIKLYILDCYYRTPGESDSYEIAYYKLESFNRKYEIVDQI